MQGEERVGVVLRWARVGAVLQVQTRAETDESLLQSTSWTLWWL